MNLDSVLTTPDSPIFTVPPTPVQSPEINLTPQQRTAQLALLNFKRRRNQDDSDIESTNKLIKPETSYF